MAISKDRLSRGVILTPDDVGVEGVEGELKVGLTSKKLHAYLDGSLRNVVTETQSQSLTNKTIDADNNTISNLEVDNLKAGVLDTDLSAVSASDDTIPSAKATKAYVDAQVTAGGASVQANLDAHIADATDAHDASAISNVPAGNLAATDVQTALDELQTDIDTRATTTALNNHISDATDAHAASAITNTPSGNLAATTVQAALNELQTDVDTRATSADLTAHISDTTTHGTTGNIVGTTDAQVVTNKDIDGGTASNTSRITLPKNTKTNLDALTRKEGTLVYSTDLSKAFVDNGTELVEVGSGSAGGINYIDNSDAEVDTAGYVRYQDAASATVENGTGGTPSANLTFTASAISPLRGAQSFLITKAAANMLGYGVSYDFTIDPADQASILRLNFDYSSGTGYADGYLRAYIYDVTNSRLIEIDNRDIAATTQGKYVGSFQTSSDSVNYRLILHCADSLSVAWEFKLDNITVSPQNLVKGAVVTDWQSYTPSLTGFGTPTNVSGMYRRVGDNLEIKVNFTSGTVAATLASLSIPSGLNIDSTKLTVQNNSSAGGTIAGTYNSGTLAPGFIGSIVTAPATSTSLVYFGYKDADSLRHLTPANGSDVTNSTTLVSAILSVPVLGWSSNLTLSEDGGTREVFTSVTRSVTQAVTGTGITKVLWDVVTEDKTGSFLSGTSEISIPESGIYDIDTSIFVSALSLDNQLIMYIYSNGSQIKRVDGSGQAVAVSFGAKASVYLNKGDLIDIRISSTDASYSVNPLSDRSWFTVAKRSSPQTLAGGETVAARYTSDSGQAIGTSATTLTFEDKVLDTHNAMSGSTYTVPESGIYNINAAYTTNNVSLAAGDSVNLLILNNGATVFRSFVRIDGATNTAQGVQCTALAVPLVKGNAITIQANISVATTMIANDDWNQFSIVKVG